MYKRQRNNGQQSPKSTHPGLSRGASAGVDQGRSARGRVGLRVETVVGSEQLDTLVVTLLNDPLLTGRGSVGIGAVTSSQSNGSTSTWVGNLERAR
jgi:hypothetical protein